MGGGSHTPKLRSSWHLVGTEGITAPEGWYPGEWGGWVSFLHVAGLLWLHACPPSEESGESGPVARDRSTKDSEE